MANVEIDIKLDMEKFAKLLAEGETEAAAIYAQRQAKALVRVDKGELRRSIDKEVRKDKAFIGSDLPYAAAQEYGIPGKKYGFTPYLRPAAQNTIAQIKAGKITPAAVKKAFLGAII
jgi:phage gpG-like protein